MSHLLQTGGVFALRAECPGIVGKGVGCRGMKCFLGIPRLRRAADDDDDDGLPEAYTWTLQNAGRCNVSMQKRSREPRVRRRACTGRPKRTGEQVFHRDQTPHQSSGDDKDTFILEKLSGIFSQKVFFSSCF